MNTVGQLSVPPQKMHSSLFTKCSTFSGKLKCDTVFARDVPPNHEIPIFLFLKKKRLVHTQPDDKLFWQTMHVPCLVHLVRAQHPYDTKGLTQSGVVQ